MSTQPNALQLADWLAACCDVNGSDELLDESAAELRRLHALNVQMLEALQAYIDADRGDQYAVVGYDTDGHPVSAQGMARIKARASIKAAQE